APLVLDIDGAEQRLHPLGPLPCHGIINAAGRERDHEFDGPLRVAALCESGARHRHRGERRRPHRQQVATAHEPHCALMPAARMTFPHFSISDLNKAAHSSGVVPTGSKPSAANFSLKSGSTTKRTISRLSRVMISLGVRAGTMTANQASPSIPG